MEVPGHIETEWHELAEQRNAQLAKASGVALSDEPLEATQIL